MILHKICNAIKLTSLKKNLAGNNNCILLKSILFALFIQLATFVNSQNLVHPSVRNSQAQLELLKYRVNNQPNSLVKKGWDIFLNTKHAFYNAPYASLNFAHKAYVTMVADNTKEVIEEWHFHGDAQAAYAHALQWVVTGKQEHKDKAIAIMNDWAKTLKGFSSNTSQPQIDLECSWAAPNWAAAADIIRYYNNGEANWSNTDIAKFNSFLNLIYTEASQTAWREQNWGSAASNAMIAVGAYLGDTAKFNAGIAAYKININAVTSASGSANEVCRDERHQQFGITVWIDACETAWHNGIDLYGYKLDGQSTPRLVLVLEFFSKIFIGVSEAPCGTRDIKYVGAQKDYAGYEAAYNHYVNRARMGSDLPNFKKMVVDNWRTKGGHERHFLNFTSFTHADISVDESIAEIIKFTTPENNQIFETGANVKVVAQAGLNVSRVVLYINNKLVRQHDASPFEWSVEQNDVDLGNLSAGQYVLKLVATDTDSKVVETLIDIEVKDPIFKAPYSGSPVNIPGTIEAEDFDIGGQGISYNDTDTENKGLAYRLTEGVDIMSVDAGFAVGHTSAGEWLEYTINASQAGDYDITIHYSSGRAGGKLDASIVGKGVLFSDLILPQTTGWGDYKIVSQTSVALEKGIQVLRFTVNTAGFNLDKFEFIKNLETSVSTVINTNNLKIYPNPSSNGQFQLNMEANWSVYSLQGLPVSKGIGKNIDLSTQVKGVYFLRVNNFTCKLIIQ